MVHFGEGTEKFGFAAGFEGLGKDGGGVKIVKNHDIFGPTAGSRREASSLVAVDGPRKVDCFCKSTMGAADRIESGRGVHGGGFCGAYIFAILLQMAFGSGKGLRQVFSDEVGSKTGPSGKETSIDGFGPRASDRTETGAMEVRYKIT